jgi:hypothetical protein
VASITLENNMTWDQIAGLLRQLLPFFGGFAVARGWLTTEQMTAAVGALITLGGIGWSIKANSKTSIIKATAGMNETNVTKGPDGTATITISDPALATAAKEVPQTSPPKDKSTS